MKKLLSGFFLLLPGLLWGQDLFDAAHSEQFATHLMESGLFRKAIPEWERAFYFEPENERFQEQLLLSYYRAGEYEQGLTRTLQIFPQPETLHPPLAWTYSRMLFRSAHYLQLTGYLNRPNALQPTQKALLQVGTALVSQDWDLAQERYQATHHLPLIAQTYQSLVKRSEHLPHRSPWLAASSSMLVPGLGKVYAGQWKDGLISLLLISSFSYLAYRNFRQNGQKSVLGWVYGGIGAGFYLGNMYGSWQAAKRYNRHQAQQLVDETLHKLLPHL